MRRRIVLGALVAVVAGALAVASASALPLSPRTLDGQQLANPCAGTATSTASNAVTPGAQTFNGVSITLPAGCGSRPVQVTVLNGTTVVASGSGTIDGTGTVGTATYTARSDLTVQVTASGWAVPTTWDYTQFADCEVSGGGSCTATVNLWTGQRPGGTASALYFDVYVTTTSTTWVTWSVTFDLSASYYGTTVTRLGNSDLDTYTDGSITFSQNGPVNDVHRITNCSLLPQLDVTGDGNQTVSTNNTTNIRNFSLVRNDHQRYFALVVNRTEAGYFDVLYPGCGAP